MGSMAFNATALGLEAMNFARRVLAEETISDGVDVTLDMAAEMDAHLSENWLWYVNYMPVFGAGLSLVCSLYIVGSNILKNDEEQSLLEEVFSFASICTAMVAALMLFSVRGDESNTAQNNPNGFICQATGAAVAYFQLATMFWLAAGSHSVYTFVCKKKTSGTISMPKLNPLSGGQPSFGASENPAAAPGAPPPAPPAAAAAVAPAVPGGMSAEEARIAQIEEKEYQLVKFYSVPCWGFPAILVLTMLLFQNSSPFGYQQLHDNGWCTVTTASPSVAFAFYHLPMLVCMYVVAACYYFCFLRVKAKRLVLEQIENEVMYDRSAHMIRKKTFLSYQRNHSASQAVRLALIVMTAVWMPVNIYGIMLIATASAKTQLGDKGMESFAKVHAFTSILAPLFGVFLFVVFEIRFKYRSLYADTFHRKVRQMKHHVRKCLKMGPPTRKTTRIKDDEDEDEDDGGFCGKIQKFIGMIYTAVQQTLELSLLVVWGLVMWVPLDVFKRDVKSTTKLLCISAVYMFCLFLPALALYKAIPTAFDTLEEWQWVDSVSDAARRTTFNAFTFTYLGFMFTVVGLTLYINRKTPELLLNDDPRSHVRKNPQNLHKVLMLVVEAQQLAALLLTHPYLEGMDHAAILRQNAFGGADTVFGSGSDVSGDGLEVAPAVDTPDVEVSVSDEIIVNFSILKLWVLDISSLEFLEPYKNEVFEVKLTLACLATAVWVMLVAIPTVVDNIRLERSATFDKIFSKVTVVQELLAGPCFFIIFSSFLATVDCAQSEDDETKWVIEERTDVECWTAGHYWYASAGLTGLMAYVPLAALTMVEDYDDKCDVRFIPLHHRIEVLTKGIMAFTVQFTNTKSPVYSFPFIGLIALWMVVATRMIKPGCIFWTNHLKEMGYSIMLWTAISGYIIYMGWEARIKGAMGIPLLPSMIMFTGWSVIGIVTIHRCNNDIAMLKKVKKKKRNQVAAWAESLTEYQAGAEAIQLAKLDSLHLGTTQGFRFQTHHEVLSLIFILRSNASAGVKQRALQILAFATGSSSSSQLSEKNKRSAAVRLTGDQAAGEDEDDTDSSSDEETSISVQSRRRLLGYEGTDQDMDESDHHFPELVLVSPLTLIDLLAQEFELSKKRDDASKQKEANNWITEEKGEEVDAADAKKKKKRFGRKKKEEVVEVNSSEAYKREGEVLFMLHRVKQMLSVEMIEGIGSAAPQQFVVKTLLSHVRKHPPDVLRLQVEGAGGKGIMMGDEHLEDDHLLEHVLELPEALLSRAADETENAAIEKIKKIRRMYAESEVHNIMKTVMHLPNECLELREDAFTTDRDEYERNHVIAKKIVRLEEEKFLIDSEINHLRDQAISIVAKVFLMRVFAVYAEHPQFARKLHQKIGAENIVEYLMHGDENLQTASTVCLYQLARQDAQCLDELDSTEGGLVFVATRMTDPLNCSVITHRIAVDLLVEVAKRFELRRPMVNAGLVGPLLTLAKAYSYILNPNHDSFTGNDSDVGHILQERMEADHETFRDSPEEGYSKNNKPGSKILTDTKQIHRWCPFKLKGVDLLSEHILLSTLRIFQQLTDEDVFRAEFIGRHHGLRWIRDFVYPIPQPNVKLMAMRVLYGMASEPFGLDDILADKKMLAVYDELCDFKAAPELENGSALVMHSRHTTVRLKIHRVAEFLGLQHNNATRKASDGKHTVRLIVIKNIAQAGESQTAKQWSHSEKDILEVARERTLDECFGICMEASASQDEALRTAATSVLTVLAKNVEFLELETYEKLNARLLECRLNAIETEDDIMYEEICVALVHLRKTKRHLLADFSFGFDSEAELFDVLWMYHHDNLCRFHACDTIEEVIQRPFWDKTRVALTPKVISLITAANPKNLRGELSKESAKLKFMRDVTLDEDTVEHKLDRMEDGGVASHQFKEVDDAAEKTREKLVSIIRSCLKVVRVRRAQDDHQKHKNAAANRALGRIMTAEDIFKLKTKKEGERKAEDKKMDASFLKPKREQLSSTKVKQTPDAFAGVKIFNPLMMAEMAVQSMDEQSPEPPPTTVTIGEPAPPGFPYAFEAEAVTGPPKVGGADSESSDESEEDDANQEFEDLKEQIAEIRRELDEYVAGMETGPMTFEITHKQRKAVHLIAAELKLVHYSQYDDVKQRRVMTIEKPKATDKQKEELKAQLLEFYNSPDGTQAKEFDPNDAELRKYLHTEAEALHIVHYSQWRDELKRKVVIIEKMTESRAEKKAATQQMVEYAADETQTEPILFNVSNEMRRFLHGICDGLGLVHVSTTEFEGEGSFRQRKRVLTVSKREAVQENQIEELIEAAIEAGPEAAKEPEPEPTATSDVENPGRQENLMVSQDEEADDASDNASAATGGPGTEDTATNVATDMDDYQVKRLAWLKGESDAAPVPPPKKGAGQYFVNFRQGVEDQKEHLKEVMHGTDTKAVAKVKSQMVTNLVDEALGKMDMSVEKDCEVVLSGKSLEGVPDEEQLTRFTVIRVSPLGDRALIQPVEDDAGFYRAGVKMPHDSSWFPVSDLTAVEAAPRRNQFVSAEGMGFKKDKKATIFEVRDDEAEDKINGGFRNFLDGEE